MTTITRRATMTVTTIVRGTARRLGIVRPLPKRELTRKERIEREAQGLSQALLSITLLRPEVIAEQPTTTLIGRDFLERRCGTCGFVADTHRRADTPDKAHRCRRDEATVIVVWPGSR